MAAYLGYTLRMRTLFRGWPIMVNDTHTRRRRSAVVHAWCSGSKRCPAAWQMSGSNCLSSKDITVICTIYFHSWLHNNHTSAAEPGNTNWNWYTGTCLSETSEGHQWAEAASEWNVVSNQQSYIDQATNQWQYCFHACLEVKSKHWTVAVA